MKNKTFSLLSLLALIFALFIQCSSDGPSKEKTINNLEDTRIIKEEEKLDLRSGSYGDLLIAFDGSKVTGYYNLVTGGGQYGCTFFFQGKTKGKKGEVPIEWYFPGEKEPSKGILVIKGEEVQLKVSGNPGGQCMPELMGDGETVYLTKDSNWKSIRMVKSKKAKLYEEDDDSMETGLDLNKNDVVCVMQSKGNWHRVEYLSEKGSKGGWIKGADLHDLR